MKRTSITALSLALSLLGASTMYGQEKSYTLSSNESGSAKTYIARDYVSLMPGFDYAATSSYSFDAKTDPTLIFPPTANYLTDEGEITSDSTCSLVGTIQGEASVTQTGAAVYQIPIDAPVGICDMKPAISIQYNSQSGIGVLGRGWDIVGISSINRVIQSFDFDVIDGKIESTTIQFNDKDRLALDGQRMFLLNGTHFCVNAEYGTEIENHSRIKVLTSAETGSIYFQVTTKEGSVFEYGKTSNSIVTNYNNSTDGKILSWKLNKATDKYGNYITYIYTHNGQDISRIYYTGTTTTEPSKLILFSYTENDINPYKTIFNDFKIVHKYLLSAIVVYSYETQLRRYNFGYLADNRLLSITETALEGEKMNATTIEWGDPSAVQEVYVAPVSESRVVSTSDKGFVQSGDVNGDGYLDRVECWMGDYDKEEDGYFNVYFFDKETMTFRTDPLTRSFPSYEDGYKPKFTVANIDDDIYGEIILINAGWIMELQYSSEYMDFLEYILPPVNLYTTAGPSGSYSMKYSSLLDYDIFSANVNNDKYMDIILVYGNLNIPALYGEDYVDTLITTDRHPGYIVYYGSDNGLQYDPNTSWHFFDDESYSKFSLGDFTGDGKMDILGLAEDFINDTIYNNELTMLTSSYWGQISKQNNFTRRVSADVNYDGLTDIIETKVEHIIQYPVVDNAIQVIINNNGIKNSPSYYEINLPLDDQYLTDMDELVSLNPIDYNGDGKVDLVVGVNGIQIDLWEGHIDTGSSDWYFYKNSNGYFTYDTIVHWDVSIQRGNGIHMADINLDGIMDLIIPKGSAYVAFTMSGNNKVSLVHTITNGLGATQEFAYSTYKDYEGSNKEGAIRNLQIPIAVVDTFIDIDGSITEYEYKSGIVHAYGKGFLGFEKVTTKNRVKNRKICSTYYAPEIYTRMCLTSQTISTYDSIEIFTMEMVNDIRVVDIEKRYIPIVSSETSTNYLDNLVSVTQNLEYDTSHNLTKQKIITGDVTTTIENFFESRLSDGPKYLPIYMKATMENGTESQIRTTHFSYNIKGDLIRKVIDSLDKSKGIIYENKMITEYKNFDQWGHATEIDVKANGMTRKTKFMYTQSGYYLQSETNHLEETTTYSWNGITCTLNSATDCWGRTTTYSYNNWGQLEETIYPDGKKSTIVSRWANEHGARYYTYTETSGGSPLWKWFDIQGRLVCEQFYGLNEVKKSVYTSYYPDGSIHVKYQPTSSNSTLIAEATYTYDSYGRIKTVTTPMGTITYSYSARKKTVVAPDGTTVSTINSAGRLFEITTNGKKVTYEYYASGKIKSATPVDGQPVSMEYDLQGNKVKITDPDAGETTFKYDGFGNLLREEKSVHSTNQNVVTINYYNSETSLLDSVVQIGKEHEVTIYLYDISNDHKSRIKSIEIPKKHKKTFIYDDFNRVINETEVFDGRSYNFTTEYDLLGRVKKETYPSGYYVSSYYDNCGNLVFVSDINGREIWRALEENDRGQLTRVRRGGKITTLVYDARGLTYEITTPGIMDLSYNYYETGEICSREDLLNDIEQMEWFSYDNLNRLIGWDTEDYNFNVYSETTIIYDSKGNITKKTDLGSENELVYDNTTTGPHALTSITGVPDDFPTTDLTITYTDFEKMDTLIEGNKSYELSYGINKERYKSVYYVNNQRAMIHHYLGDYEEEIDASNNFRKIHYLYGGAIYIQNNGEDSLLYAYTDHQGSLTALVNESGDVIERYSYDPWGVRRYPDDWSLKDIRTHWIINRGYTGHEHLDEFGIINMNGRVYDPQTAMFFSPDPFLQAPDDWLNYNRYSYALNNPLKYTDPSGYFYWGVGLGWSWYGGLTVSASVGVGFWQYCSAGITIGYGFGNNNFFATVNATAALFYSYGGYDTKAGFITGTGFGLNQYTGAPISTNILDAGIGWSQSAGWSANVCGWQITGQSSYFDPSIGVSYVNRTMIDNWLKSIWFENQYRKTIESLNAELERIREGYQNMDLPEVDLVMLKVEGVTSGRRGYCIEMTRFAESPDATVSRYLIYAPEGNSISGYFLEPGGPSTTTSGIDKRIPTGTYMVQLTYSPRFEKNMFLISNDQVPASRGVRIHIGNFHFDTEACLLPGNYYGYSNGNYYVGGSKANYMQLRAFLGDDNTILTIK